MSGDAAKSGGNTTAQSETLKNNKAVGKAWENQVASKLRVGYQREVYIQPLNNAGQPMLKDNGKPLTVRVDIMKLNKTGPALIECKNGPFAPLTKNQAAAIPNIEKNGFKVLSNRPEVPKGMTCGPTKVQVVRPEHGRVWNGSGTTLHPSGGGLSVGARFMGQVAAIGRAAGTVAVAVSAYDVGSKLYSGDYRGAAVSAGGTAGGFAGAAAGAKLGAVAGGAFGPVGSALGAAAGGLIGGIVGGLSAAHATHAAMDACANGAGLGKGGGDIGGVAIRHVASISPLKQLPEFILADEHIVAIPIKTRAVSVQRWLPATTNDNLMQRIFHEVYWALVVEKAPLLFSLHFAEAGYLYPVMHPYLQRTLTGHVLGLLDYFLKGFVNGGVYDPAFLLQWHIVHGRNMSPDFLKEHLIDIRSHLKQNGAARLQYQSLRELFACDDEEEEDDEENIATNRGGETVEALKKRQAYRSAFRILGKLDKVRGGTGAVLTPVTDFDVEHDLNPSAKMRARLSQTSNGTLHAKHKKKADAYQAMHEAVHEKMPQVPMFAEWFELLKVVTFSAHYVQTLVESGMEVDVPAPELLQPFPDAMPPIPVRRVQSFAVGVTLAHVRDNIDVAKIDAVLSDIIKENAFSFERIAEDLRIAARRAVCKQLQPLLLAEEVADRDDGELRVGQLVSHTQAILTQLMKVATDNALDSVLTAVKDLDGVAALRGELEQLPTFHQRIAFLREHVSQLTERWAAKCCEALERSLADRRVSLQKQADEAIAKQSEDVQAQEREVRQKIDENEAERLADLARQVDAESTRINSMVNNVPAGYTIDFAALQSARDGLQRQAQEIQQRIAQDKAKSLHDLNTKTADVLRDMRADVIRQQRELLAKDEAEAASKKSKINEEKSKLSATMIGMLSDAEKGADKVLSDAPMIALQLPLLEHIRLSFISVGDNTAWAQGVVGGCSVVVHQAPVFIKETLTGAVADTVADFRRQASLEAFSGGHWMAKIKVARKWYASPSSFSAAVDFKRPADLSLAEGPFVNVHDELVAAGSTGVVQGFTALDWAIRAGDLQLVQRLVQSTPGRVIPNLSQHQSLPPLIAAVAHNHEAIVQCLVQSAADVNVRHPNGLTALLVACQSGFSGIAKLLLQQGGISVTVALDNGMTPMHFAVVNEDVEVVERLLQLGVNPFQHHRLSDGCTPFLLSAKLGLARVLAVMCAVSDPAGATATDDAGDGPLHYAARSGEDAASCVRLLLGRLKLAANVPNCRGQLPLHYAVSHSADAAAVALLEAHPGGSSEYDHQRHTPVDIALASGASAFLVAASHRSSFKTQPRPQGACAQHGTVEAIYSAILRQSAPDVSRLLGHFVTSQGCDVANDTLESFLKTAFSVGSDRMLDIVVRATPNISTLRFSGNRALSHIVVSEGQHRLVPMVHRFAFDFLEKDAAGLTPIELAVDADDADVAEAILTCTAAAMPPTHDGANETTDANLVEALAVQRAFQFRKAKCINALLLMNARRSGGRSMVSLRGSFLCQSLATTEKDVALARHHGVSFEDADLVAAAGLAAPEVLLSVLQLHCGDNEGLHEMLLPKCLQRAVECERLDNIMALVGLPIVESSETLRNEVQRLIWSRGANETWVRHALRGDAEGAIKQRVLEIRGLLANGVDACVAGGDRKTGLQRRMSELLDGFPLKNMPLGGEPNLPFLHLAMVEHAPWAWSCLPKDCDRTLKCHGASAFDLLPKAPGALRYIRHLGPRARPFAIVLDNLTPQFADIVKSQGGEGSELVSELCKVAHEASKPSILHLLICAKASVDDLRPLLKEKPGWATAADAEGWTPLMRAVDTGNLEVASLLLESDVPATSLRAANRAGRTALHVLVAATVFARDDYAVVSFARRLAEKEPSALQMPSREGETPVCLAARAGHLSFVAAFISCCSEAYLSLALHAAASADQVGVLRFLVLMARVPVGASKQTVYKEGSDVVGDTPLHTAARHQATEAFTELLRLGADPLCENSQHECPFELALRSGSDDISAVSVATPALLNAPGKLRSRVLIAAARGAQSSVGILSTLLSLGFSANALDADVAVSALQYAAIHDNVEAVHCLLGAGANLLHRTALQETVLHLCAGHQAAGTLRACLEWAAVHCSSSSQFGKWRDAADRAGDMALHTAARKNDYAAVTLLLAYGADHMAMNAAMLTAGQVALVHRSLNAMGVLNVLTDNVTATADADNLPIEFRNDAQRFVLDISLGHKTAPCPLDAEMIGKVKNMRDSLPALLKELDSSDGTSTAAGAEELTDYTASDSDSEATRSTKIRRLCETGPANLAEQLAEHPLAQAKVLAILSQKVSVLDLGIARMEHLCAGGRHDRLSALAVALPGLPVAAFPELVKAMEFAAKKQEDLLWPEVWDWFAAHFALPCDPAALKDSVGIPSPSLWAKWFTVFLQSVKAPASSPKLPNMSVFLGRACSMRVLAHAMQLGCDPTLQLSLVNELPGSVEALEALALAMRRSIPGSAPAFFSFRALSMSVDGGCVAEATLNKLAKTRAGPSTAVEAMHCSEAVTLLAMRAMLHNSPAVIGFLGDLRSSNSKTTTKAILDAALRVEPPQYSTMRAWGAAAEMLHDQCGDHVLHAICKLVASLQLQGVLAICGIILRLPDTSGVLEAVERRAQDVRGAVEKLMAKANPVKNIDTILCEMTTPAVGQFRPHEFPFDGRPVVCITDSESAALRKVHDAMMVHSVPSTRPELRQQCADLGAALREGRSEAERLQTLGQLLAVLSYSFEVVFKKNPYLIQRMTVAALLLAEILPRPERKGRIAQVATGEGKSISIVLTAAVCGVQGRTVDIITSTAYLARRDKKEFEPFFNFIGLTCGCVSIEPGPTEVHFHARVLYGTNTDFEFTILREGIRSEPIQVSPDPVTGLIRARTPDTIISDESDNLFLDNALNSARIAWASDENVSWVFAPLLELVRTDPSVSQDGARQHLCEYRGGQYFDIARRFSDTRLATWLSSARSALSRTKGEDYVLGRNQRTGKLEVQIVHVGTGRVQHGMRWSQGQHEFVEARESLVPQNENHTIASIAHPSFFGRYSHIYGLTGTAGEPSERHEVEQTYGVDSFDIPPNRKCLRQRLPTRIVPDSTQHRDMLVETIREMQRKGRPILLLFEFIESSVAFSKHLCSIGIQHHILNEQQREDEDFVVFRAGQPGVPTVATNTAGRGTDIVLSALARKAGGLHVAFTFFPENFRVECQGLGRAGRQGDPGSAEIVISLQDRFARELLGTRLRLGLPLTALGIEELVEELYRARTAKVMELSGIREKRSVFEKQLHRGLQVFFVAMLRLHDRFQFDAKFAACFDGAVGTAPDVWHKAQHRLNCLWARFFTMLSDASDHDLSTGFLQLEEHCNQNFVARYIDPLMQTDASAAARACMALLV